MHLLVPCYKECSFSSSPQRPRWKKPTLHMQRHCDTVPSYFSVLPQKKREPIITLNSGHQFSLRGSQRQAIHSAVFLWLSAWSHLVLWWATFTTIMLHLHPYISIYCMLSPSTQEVIFLITTSYHNDWYSQCYIYQEAGKTSMAIRCHQHSQPIQTDFSQHIRLQLHKTHLSSSSSLNT